MPQTINEVNFCGQIASAVNELIRQDSSRYPFTKVNIEEYAEGSRKRNDLRFYGKNGKILLSGEVKLPGQKDGDSPFNENLMQDAAAKADINGVKYFFTWNVNEFALFDRSKWELPQLERKVYGERLGRIFRNPQEVAQEQNLTFIKTAFLPNLLNTLSDFILGRRADWWKPDELFIRSLESRLEWPVELLKTFILEESSKKLFDNKVQAWMTKQEWTYKRNDPVAWSGSVENMAKTLAYVWVNRLIFYKTLRSRFGLKKLELTISIKSATQAFEKLTDLFASAEEKSGDYESLLMSRERTWELRLVFDPPYAVDAWRALIRGLESVDFSEVSSDIVGRIFQKLIGPEERHRYGQHFTGDDAVDLINTFCIRKGDASVLDPACGSGSFLVRAYYRKHLLNKKKSHLELISELFGTDIAPYPAHLATLNLAAREINDEANYPRIVRKNFFDVKVNRPFCELPDGNGGIESIMLPKLNAIVGNPPYVRQEKIEKDDKKKYSQLVSDITGFELSGRSDLHCYFWPVATNLLVNDGYFGFLTSSSWLDVDYGFALQGWILKHFRILAIMESAAEPWFEDARVKTCATILQRCDNEQARAANIVPFVKFKKPLAIITGIPAGENDQARFASFEKLRDSILQTKNDIETDELRIIVKSQKELWEAGVNAGKIVTGNEEETDEEDQIEHDELAANSEYVAGKWGRYLRAPDIYFEIMQRYGKQFVPLGTLADIRFGVKSGCDDFFMPWDISERLLNEYQDDREFRKFAAGASRKEVTSGKLKIVEAGDGSIHPIESKFLETEVHTIMDLPQMRVIKQDLKRVVLLVNEPLDTLRKTSPWVYNYILYGKNNTFSSKKAKAVPVPDRATCANRDPWYDLTGSVNDAFALWPKGLQYRHMVVANPENIVANQRLYTMQSLDKYDTTVFIAILNSTLVALLRIFYGRYVGMEGAQETMVIDAKMIDVPDPRNVSANLKARMLKAFASLSHRIIGNLCEEQLMECHSPERARKLASGPLVLSKELQEEDRRELDDAVFELIGVSDKVERARLLNELYRATAEYFRQIRAVEIEKMEQRSRSNTHDRFDAHDLAADIWDAAELADARPIKDWLETEIKTQVNIEIPEERPVIFIENPLFEENTVYFGRKKERFVKCTSYVQAELVARMAELDISGKVQIPSSQRDCQQALKLLNERLQNSFDRFQTLAESRTSDGRIQKEVLQLLNRWFALGRGKVSSLRDSGS